MVAIKLSAFGGMIPAVDDRLLPDQMASYAKNVWLYSGTLQGMRQPVSLYTCLNSNTKKLYRIPKNYVDQDHLVDSYWLEFPYQDVDVIPSLVANDSYERYYWAIGTASGAAIAPRYNTLDRIIAGSSSFLLGVPAPTVAPGVTLSPSQPMEAAASSYKIGLNSVSLKAITASGTTVVNFVAEASPVGPSGFDAAEIISSRAYAYTWVTAYGEEGPPSPATVATGLATDKWSLTLTPPGIGVTADRNITKVRIYRTVTSSAGIATYFFVTELPIANTSYIDTNSDTSVSANEQLASSNWYPPPTDLQGMYVMPNGMVVGFRDNEIWFCEPYRPHAWPSIYTQSVDSVIVGIGVVGQTAVVCTTTATYACTGVNPAVMTLSKISMREACLSRGSIVSTPAGVFYITTNGLAAAVAGQVVNATEALFTKDKWRSQFRLQTTRGAKFGSAYYAFGSITAGCFQDDFIQPTAFELGDYSGSREGGIINATESKSAFTVLASDDPTMNIWNDPWTNEVLVLRDGQVFHIDVSSDVAYDEYTWRSKRFQPTNLKNLEAMKIYFDNPEGLTSLGTVKIYADDRLVMTKPLVKSGQHIRLPSGFKASYWQVEVTTKVIISSIQMATSMRELASV